MCIGSYALVTSAKDSEKINKVISKILINPRIASFDLSLLCTSQQDSLQSACKMLASEIKQTITRDSSKSTVGVNQTMKLLRYAVTCYLNEQNSSNLVQVKKILSQESRLKAGPVKKITSAMRLKSIPITQYQHLWAELTKSRDAVHTALLVMLFLGLTSEEVCGLQQQDYQQIFEHPGFYQLRITRRLSSNQGNQHILELLDDDHACRNIPLPYQIRREIKPFIRDASNPSQYLFRRGNKPLKPELLEKELFTLLNPPANVISITDNHKRKREINVGFDSKSYRESCRYYFIISRIS